MTGNPRSIKAPGPSMKPRIGGRAGERVGVKSCTTTPLSHPCHKFGRASDVEDGINHDFTSTQPKTIQMVPSPTCEPSKKNNLSGNRARSGNTTDALAMASRHAHVKTETIIHVDRWPWNTTGDFDKLHHGSRITPGRGKTGACLNNAIASDFFRLLKNEMC